MKYYLIAILSIFCTLFTKAQTKESTEKAYDSLLKKGQKESIIPYFEKELQLHPDNEAVLRMLGYLYIEDNKMDAGEKCYRKVLISNPKCGPCYINIGRGFAMKGNFKRALDLADSAINAESYNAYLYAMRGRINEINNDVPGALRDYNRAIELDPKNADYLIDRAKFNSGQTFFSLALADLNKAIILDPKRYDVYMQRAEIYYYKQRFNDALNDVNTGLQLDSTQANLYAGRAAIYDVLKEYDKAIADYTKAIQLDSTAYMTYYNRAGIKYAKEDMDSYCIDIRKCLSVLNKYAPDDTAKIHIANSIENCCDSTKASYYFQRGIAFYNLEQFDKAVKIYTRGLKKFPQNSMTLSFRGNAYLAMNAFNNALADYYQSIKNKDNLLADIIANQKHTLIALDKAGDFMTRFMATIQLSIAECKFGLKQYEEALTDVNKAINTILPVKEETEKARYYNIRGNILMGLGKYQEALDDFNKCISENEFFALAYINRAIAKANIGDQVKMTSYSVTGAFNSQTSNARWIFPVKTVIKKSDSNVLSALNDCNKAIGIEPKAGFGYYVRGQVKKMLEYNNYCDDFLKATELNYPVEPEFLSGCK